ncbi:MAG: beta-aspartyl-peptidase [Pseudomonadota bacterium]
MFTLIQKADVFAPQHIGQRDVLIADEKIAMIAGQIKFPRNWPIEVINAEGRLLTPGLIDLHVHVIGGGGEGGPATRVPEIKLSDITMAGVTTVLGVLGTDDITRHPESLLAKTQGFEQEGITAFCMAGSYRFPLAATVTGSLRKDIALIPQIIGVGEIALSDHRSAQPTFEDFAKICAEARIGGLIGGKAGLVQIHMGSGISHFNYLFRLIKETEIPIGQIMPTHVSRDEALFKEAIKFCLMDGNVDITASGRRLNWRMSGGEALKEMLSAGVSIDRITFSSDSNGSMPLFDEKGQYKGMAIGEIANLPAELRRLIIDDGFDAADVLQAFTINPARRLKMDHRKGLIQEGRDADLVLFKPDWTIDKVFARGRLMVSDGQAVVWGLLEQAEQPANERR